MNKSILFAFAAGSLLLGGCSNDLEYTPVPSTGMLRASVEGSQSSTRAGFDQGGAFYWSAGDQLGVTTSDNASAFSALTLEAEAAGQASGSFSGTISGSIGDYAVYPYREGHSMSGTTLTYKFPETYGYEKVDADFCSAEQGHGNSFNPAMWGKIQNGSVQLKHLGGVVCIKIEQMPVAEGTLTLVTDKKVTGAFTVDLSGETPALAVPAEAAAADATDNTVTITFSNATVNNPGVFYVPVPTGSYDVRIKVSEKQSGNSDSKDKVNVAAGSYVIARCDLKKIELKNVTIEGTVTEAQDLSGAATSLGCSDAVTVSGEVTSTSNEISVPAVTESESTTAKSLSLEKVASGASIKVTDGNTETEQSNKSVDKFTLSIPNNETEGHTPLAVEIAMPNTTVTLAGNGGSATYGQVTAETAANTLVVESGVTVKKIIVKKGNIRVKKGAKVEAIEKSSDFSGEGKIKIYVETGAEYPTGLSTESFEVVKDDESSILDVLANGGYCSLSSDLTGDFVVSAKTPVTIDLNGHKITNKAGDTFTVNNGSTLTIMGEGTVDNVSHQKACIYNNGTVTLNGGTYTRSKENGQNNSSDGGNSFYNILNHGKMTINKGVTVSQKGKFSSMIANGYYNYSSTDPRSGHVSGTNNAAPTMVINDGTFDGGMNAVKNDDGATLEINNGHFMNFSRAAVMNHNTATINGGTFTGVSAQFVIDNVGHNNESHDLGDLTIKGGHFSGKINNNDTKGGADLTLIGGTFSDLNAIGFASQDTDGNDNGNGLIINLSEDVVLSNQIVSKGKNVELHLNGHTISNTSDIWNDGESKAWSLISVQGGKLTIRDQGLLDAKENDCYALDVRNGASLVVVDGTYKGNCHAVYVFEGKAEIHGGEYSIKQVMNVADKPYEFVLNCYDSHYSSTPKKADIVVYGGKFHKFNPASNGAEGVKGSTNFCAEGYTATTSDNGDTYVVSQTQQ